MSRTYKDRRPRDDQYGREVRSDRAQRMRQTLQDAVKAHKASGSVDYTLDWDDD